MKPIWQTWIWRRLTHNAGWKLASLALSALLWYLVVGEPELVTIQPVPVLYRNVPQRLILLPDAPSEVRAELRGASGRLTRSTLSDVFAAVDLAGVAGPGAQTFTLSQADFNLPQGVSFLRVVPSQVNLSFDRITSKAVPVTIQLKGTLPPGYKLTGQSVEPSMLNISGPEQNVNGIQSAETDPVGISGLSETTEIKVNTFLSDKGVHFESPSVVTVRLTIEKTGEQR